MLGWPQKRAVQGLLLVGGLALLLGGLGLWRLAAALHRPLEFGEHSYVIEKGTTLSAIVDDLMARKILDNPYSLKLLAYKDQLGRKIKAGEYRFPAGIEPAQFLQQITSGEGQVNTRLTIIEGWTFKQMRQKIAAQDDLRQVVRALTDDQLMRKLGHPGLHPEGQFYPDTYHYHAGETDFFLYRKAFERMQHKLRQAWQQRADGIQLQSAYEALILASIIEKETQNAEERALVSGVFDNRLRIGMRLQTDPTVIYGIGDAYNGNIQRKHLKQATPYNTYHIPRLPPTPISLPGDGALLAAVRPAKTDAYFFSARGGGRHVFSRTLDEHNRAVRKYLLGQGAQ